MLQTATPTLGFKLGKFVTVRPRADGTHRVLFELPPRLRPSDWLPTQPLPLLAPRRGDLTDADEVARIQRDAARLYAELLAAREAQNQSAEPASHTMETLVSSWHVSQAWKRLRPVTRLGYDFFANQVLAWAKRKGDPDPTKITRAAVENFLAEYDDRPTTRYHVRKVLRLILDQAVALGWRQDNPVDGVKVAMPKSRVKIWECADVDRLAWAAAVSGRPDLAALILTECEIGQRLTDLILMRRTLRSEDEGYDAATGEFRFHQSKTGAFVTIPIGPRAQAALAAISRQDSPYLFHDTTGRPFRDVGRLGHVFEDVRLAAAGRHVVLRALRHSCVVQLARAGCTVPEIASITGHAITSVEAILSVYLPRDTQVARRAQAKRGLI